MRGGSREGIGGLEPLLVIQAAEDRAGHLPWPSPGKPKRDVSPHLSHSVPTADVIIRIVGPLHISLEHATPAGRTVRPLQGPVTAGDRATSELNPASPSRRMLAVQAPPLLSAIVAHTGASRVQPANSTR